MNDRVNTSRVTSRRSLRFESVDQVLEEIEDLSQADGEGRLRTLGNWTPGQIMAHVAAWIEYGYDGFPVGPPPWFIRWILRRQLKKYLRNGMPSGVRIPGAENGTYGMDEMSTSEAAERLRKAFLRLKSGEPPKFHSPAFGEMSHEDRIRLNLRHAELHLGFLEIA